MPITCQLYIISTNQGYVWSPASFLDDRGHWLFTPKSHNAGCFTNEEAKILAEAWGSTAKIIPSNHIMEE